MFLALSWAAAACEFLYLGEGESIYSVELQVSNGDTELHLMFGQDQQPEDRIRVSPPPPPEGAFHSWFQRSDGEYLADYRQYDVAEVIWELHFQSAGSDEIILNWSIEIEEMDGAISLLDDEGLMLVSDISETDQFQFAASEIDYLHFFYRIEGTPIEEESDE